MGEVDFKRPTSHANTSVKFEAVEIRHRQKTGECSLELAVRHLTIYEARIEHLAKNPNSAPTATRTNEPPLHNGRDTCQPLTDEVVETGLNKCRPSQRSKFSTRHTHLTKNAEGRRNSDAVATSDTVAEVRPMQQVRRRLCRSALRPLKRGYLDHLRHCPGAHHHRAVACEANALGPADSTAPTTRCSFVSGAPATRKTFGYTASSKPARTWLRASRPVMPICSREAMPCWRRIVAMSFGDRDAMRQVSRRGVTHFPGLYTPDLCAIPTRRTSIAHKERLGG
jgi:hypothetical protein